MTVQSEPSVSSTKADLKPKDEPSAGGSKVKAPDNKTSAQEERINDEEKRETTKTEFEE